MNTGKSEAQNAGQRAGVELDKAKKHVAGQDEVKEGKFSDEHDKLATGPTVPGQEIEKQREENQQIKEKVTTDHIG